jgi:hypothetical protein
MSCSQESHDLLLLSPQWSSLEPAGIQPTYDEPGQPQFLELRNCSCGSTLARPVEQARVEGE